MAQQIPLKYIATQNKLGEYSAGDFTPIQFGGTGATTAEQARTNLSVPSVSEFNSHISDSQNPHNVTAAQIGAAAQSALDQHTSSTQNPHNVTATQIGAATQTDFSNHVSNSQNPHNVTAAQIGAATATDLTSHAQSNTNPHNVTAAQIGAATSADLTGHSSNQANPHNVTAAQTGAVEQSKVGVAGGVAPLDGSGKIPTSFIPASALPEVHVVADQAQRLLLSVGEGDEAIQTNDGSHWIYDGSVWHTRPSSGGNVVGPASALADNIPVFDGSSGKTLKDSGLSVTAPGEINGRNIAQDGALLDSLQTSATPSVAVVQSSAPLDINSVAKLMTWSQVSGLFDPAYSIPTAAEVSASIAGVYEISYNVPFVNLSNGRSNPGAVVKINGVELVRSKSYDYVRNNASSRGTLHWLGLVTLSANSVITVEVATYDGGTVRVSSGEASLTMRRVK